MGTTTALRAGSLWAMLAAGYEEGARRVVSCPRGHLTGVDLYLHGRGSVGSVVQGIRFHCSKGDLQVEYVGLKPDSLVFGSDNGHKLEGKCPDGKALAGFKWRQSDETGEGGYKHTISEVQVLCGSEAAEPLVLAWTAGRDAAKTQQDLQSHVCSDDPSNPRGGSAAVHSIAVWYIRESITGWQIEKCKAAPS